MPIAVRCLVAYARDAFAFVLWLYAHGDGGRFVPPGLLTSRAFCCRQHSLGPEMLKELDARVTKCEEKATKAEVRRGTLSARDHVSP